MEQVVKELESAGITVRRFTCEYLIIYFYKFKEKGEFKVYIILNKFHGFELIPPFPGEVKYFRTISELIEYVKK